VSNELIVFEKEISPLAPYFEQALAHVMPVERFMRTLIISAEKVPKILECSRQSLMNSAMSAALLGLEPDGVTGQSYILPFKNQAQLIVGYKGYNTIGARSGLTVTGEAVHENDAFDYQLGTGAFVRHKPALSNRGRVIAAWAQAEAIGRPPIISVLGLEAIMATKDKSPGGKRSDSPWNDHAIGFPAMASKTAKRRLSRSMPLNVNAPQYHLAARLDEAHEEEGKHAWIDPAKGLQITQTFPIDQPSETPTAAQMTTRVDATLDALKAVAREGWDALKHHWTKKLTEADRLKYRDTQLPGLKEIAEKADIAAGRMPEPGAMVPTTEPEYVQHFNAWLTHSSDENAARLRWTSSPEKELRDKCNVGGEMREELFKQLVAKFNK